MKENPQELQIINLEDQVLLKAVRDAQLLILYIVNNNALQADEATIQTIVNTKYLLQNGEWSTENEVAFWSALSLLTNTIKPVTLASIKENYYVKDSKGLFRTRLGSQAQKAKFKYSILAFFALVVLLFTQIYWIVGNSAYEEINLLFEKRQKLRLELQREREREISTSTSVNAITGLEAIYNQKIDSNLHILNLWNKVWSSLVPPQLFIPKIREYRITKLKSDILVQLQSKLKTDIDSKKKIHDTNSDIDDLKSYIDDLSKPLVGNENDMVRKGKLKLAVLDARHKLFTALLYAKFVLIILHSYLLPLLYGMMGSIVYTLRTLSKNIENLTYQSSHQIKYNLHIVLGTLSGLIVGFFLKPEEPTFGIAMPSMALAFLAGYNVEILFSVMDEWVKNFLATK
ncbi:MAG: hypothetical protein VSS52_005705 [Thiotrichaceae bacterium]|nr:hypothetical protein [Thiotrichaceae bacterium]